MLPSPAVSAGVSCEVEGRKAESGRIDICGGEGEVVAAAVLGPSVREDHHPGPVPGFEHSVNAEPGSMGAGAGAAAAIDHNEPSPRGAAIEKAQAELRWDLAVREERRRELEFLEKGGEPLDFKFGEVPSLTFSSPSPAEPLADQLLFSEGEGGSVANAIANGGACENVVIQGVSGGSDVKVDERSCAVNAKDATEDTIPSKARSPRPDLSARTKIDSLLTKRESEDVGVGRVGAKTQSYVKRNRQRSQRLGNGHLALKEQEKVVDANNSSFVVEADTDEAPGGAAKDEARVDKMGFRALPPHQSPHAAASEKWNGVKTTKPELKEPAIEEEVMTRCGALLEQQHAAADVSTDVVVVGKGRDIAVLPSPHVSLKSGDVGVNLCVSTREKDGLALAGKGSNVDLFFSREQPSAHVQSFCERGELGAGLQDEHVHGKSVLGRASANPPDRARDEGHTATTAHTGHGTARREAQEGDGTTPPLPPSKSNSIEKGSSRAHQVVSEGGADGPPRSSVHEQSLSSSEVTEANGNSMPVTQLGLEDLEGRSTLKNSMIKKAVARGSSHVRQVNRDRSAQDEKRLNASNARIKVEDVAVEARAMPSVTTEVEVSSSPMSGGAPKPQELRTEGQAGVAVGGIPRSIGRTSSSSALLKNKFPGVVIPWEKEHDPIVEAEAAKHRAEISAKARKAREDFILEEAQHLQAVRNSTVDQVLDKPWPEGSRRKAHWDFVLEEMAWMANDFMQESLWKRAAAAQICRCVALQRRQDDFLASELSTRQRRVAKVLANAVDCFWQSVEECSSKEKAGTSTLEKTQTQAGNNSNEDVDEAVPMDVDVPAVEEAAGVGSEKVNKKKSMAIHQYAMRFLKSSSFESMAQAKAPADRLKRHSDRTNSVLEPFWEDRFPKESLFYVVPDGSMDVYRASVESHWAMLEAKLVRELASEIDAEVQAVGDAAGNNAAVGCDFGYYGNDGGSQDDDLQLRSMLNSLGSGGGLPGIAKKKRKKIPKVNTTAVPKVEAGGPVSEFGYEPLVSGGDQGLPSPAVTGKRSLSGHSGISSLPGSIPTKRARSSAGNLRQPRAPGVSTSPGTLGPNFPRSMAGSQLLQQDELMDVLDGSNNREDNSSDNNNAPSDTLHAVVVSEGTFVPPKSKKKKKLKHSLGGPFATRQGESALLSGNASIKASDGDHGRQDLQPNYEVMKRKGDQLLPPGVPASETGLGIASDASEIPGLKKSKVSDGNSEAISGPVQPALQTGQQSVPSGGNKPTRPNRPNNQKIKSSKGAPLNAPTGNGIPWSSVEDQAILVLVHDLGPNWELVSDVLSYNSQLKGIYRKPKLCRERHKFLSERLGTEILENSDDLSPLQMPTAQPPGIPKGNNTRLLLQRIHGTVEEDSLKVHLEQIVLTWEKFRPRKPTNAQEQKVLATPHPSHGIAISQFCTGGPPNPLDLCDRVTAEVPIPSFTMQPSPHGNGPGLPSGGLPPGSSLRPPSSGMPPGLPGSNGLPLGTLTASSSATINAAAARDAQRFTAMCLSPEETNRLRMATTMGSLGAYNRRLQQQVVSPTTSFPVLSGLPIPNDLPLLPTGPATAGLLSNLGRSMSLPRPGLSGLGSAAVSSMGSAGLGIMLPPGGVNLGSNSGSLPSGAVSGQFMARKTREILQRMTGCSEEQRMQLIQQLQHQALQGEPQAAAALASLNSDMAVVSSPPLSFSHQHQQQQQHQAQQRQRNQQLQLQNHQSQQQQQQQQQAWQLQAARVNEQQRQQQLQQQKRLMGAIPALAQPHTPNPQQQQQQQMLAPNQPYVRSLSSQHMGPQSQHAISQQSHTLQKQLGQQQQQVGGGPSQVQQSSLPPSSLLQSAPVSPTGSGPSPLTSQQQPVPQQNQAPGQMPQIAGPAKQVQSKQSQKHQQQNQQQQQASRVSKGSSRGPMMMQQGQIPQSNNLPGNLSIGSNSVLGELAGQPGAHPLQQGQRVVHQPQVQMQSGKLQSWSQQSMSGKLPPMQSQGAQLQGGAQSQGLASVAVQQQGQQQQQSQQQAVASQQQAQPATFPQQSPPPPPQQQLSSSAPIQQPQLQPPVPGQQQLQQSQQQQQQQRRPMQQQQEPPPQRSQMRHLGTAMGLPMPGQVGKTGMQLQGQGVSSQMASQPGTPTYQLGSPISMSGPSPHVTSLSSGLNATAVGMNSSQWKSPMSGGMFNLTRTGSPVPAHIPPVVAAASSGLHIPSSNGNMGSSIHGASMGGVLPQAHAVMQGVPGQKFAVGPGQIGREIAGSQQGVTAGPEQTQQGSMPVSLATSNVAAAQTTRLPVQPSSSAMLPGSTMGLVTSGPPNAAYQGVVPVASPGHSSSMPGSGLLYTMQPHQPPHVGNVSTTGSAVSQRSASPASNGPALTAAMSAMGSTSLSVMPAGAVPSSSA